ncbi:uncharacterized protein EDB91DRAFT_203324 [Suillus paluster]|uniref:uncharacterized protein n=1 Tax=Suillus paluster TaxID=48578 RepID=UPI001B85BFD9|nr:uncharacterized protein EDB91DRAFT_203324 [Suillus paluster]KAG1722637.1 hypothetical protein EDB91DRAFT_203324 [Suillus paluster]
MSLTAQERIALKSLPKRVQRLIDGALKGVVHDVRKLHQWVETSADVEANMTLLPIFYTHLDPAVIPDQLLPTNDIQKVVMLAKLSLISILKACSGVTTVDKRVAEVMITDAVVRRWDVLFPWIQFMYRHFLPASPRSHPPEGFDVYVVDVVSMTTRALHHMAVYSVEGKNLIRTNITLQHFIAKLWLYIGKLKEGDLSLGVEISEDEAAGLGHIRGVMAGVIITCVGSPPAPSTLHNLLDAAGGYERFVVSALRYVRWLGRAIGDMHMSNKLMMSPPYVRVTAMLALVDSLSVSIHFITVVSLVDAMCQEGLILHGAPSEVVTALRQAWPNISGMRVSPSMEHSAAVRSTGLLEHAFGYADAVLCRSEACIPAVCQVLDAGLIQLVLQAGFRCPQTACRVLKLIPRFLMYHKVLRHFQNAMNRTDNAAARLGVHARKHEEVQQAWALVQQLALHILGICRRTSASPFYEQKCANLECPCDNNERPHYRCTGCFIARYCSRDCQRIDWKSRHRNACTLLYSAVGMDGSKDIRHSLPLIMLTETFNYSLYADRIQEAMEQARKEYPEETDRLVLETNLSAYPVTFSARPVEQYADMFDSRFDPAMLTELRGLPGKHILMAIKLRIGREERVVLSPRMGLTLAFQWPRAKEEDSVLSGVQQALVTRLAVGPGNVIKRGEGYKVVEFKPPPIAKSDT